MVDTDDGRPPRGLDRLRPAALPSNPDEAEAALTEFWVDYVDSDLDRGRFLLRHPLRTAGAVAAMARLPVVEVSTPTSADADGERVRRALRMPGFVGVPGRATGLATLRVPADPAAYSEGRRARTLRRKCRKAEERGVTCRLVDDVDERRRLLSRIDAAAPAHPDPRYRNPDPDNRDTLEHDLWLVAESASGDPLLVAVAPHVDELATLRYFRTLDWSPEHSDTRYLGTRVLVEELSRRGVRLLVDNQHPGGQTNGVRHFQRMLGFRLRRVRLRDDADSPTT